ncbi:MAG: glycosyltransferase family 2 protein [Chitinispirillales bacterium]|jgi:glycosyltransferase involved in cell wall biosynthesis|nr:glycosyltransferase family 2 protein [Chitinispirillales bacterium]
MAYVTVFTPTYNRKHTLKRAFESLQRQTFLDFIWLIVDDGSTDDTNELVEEFKKEAVFPIEYYYKENGGKHTAYNFSHEFVKTEYRITLDSDDELPDNTLEQIKKAWESIPQEDYDRFWCLRGRCIVAETGEVMSDEWPQGINTLKGKKQHKQVLKALKGENPLCQKSNIFCKYLYPIYPGFKGTLPPGIIYETVNSDYDQYCVNDIFTIYHTDTPNSLVKTIPPQRYYYMSQYCINNMFEQVTYNKRIFKSLLSIYPNAKKSGIKFTEMMRDSNAWYKKLLILTLMPFSVIVWTFKEIHDKHFK